MTATIVVTGGTGRIGRPAVERLHEAGHTVRVLTRHPGQDTPGITHVQGDTVAGSGLDRAFMGAATVVHLAGGARGDAVAAQHVAAAARAAGVGHLLLISVIGADRMPIGYFRAKREAEENIAASGVPWTVLRVAQLHDFVLPMARFLASVPFAPRHLRFEPIDVAPVADRLAALAGAPAAGLVPDLAGPEVLGVDVLLAQYRAAHGKQPRRSAGMPLAGAIGRAYRNGDNLAGSDARRAGISWREFLARRAD